MMGYYTPILALQAFCLYHAYKNRNEQKWYWLILFFPGFGCLIYLYENFYSRGSISTITEGVKGVVNSNYKIEQLEKALKFSDNLTNRSNLADAYVLTGRYEEAISLYKECMKGFMLDDPALLLKLLQASFLNKEYNTVIDCGLKLETNKGFKNSEERISYAWAYYHIQNIDKARLIFEDLDKPYTNYLHRIEYSRFLMEIGLSDASVEKADELLEEFEHMKPHEKRANSKTYRIVKNVSNSLRKGVKES